MNILSPETHQRGLLLSVRGSPGEQWVACADALRQLARAGLCEVEEQSDGGVRAWPNKSTPHKSPTPTN